MKKLVGSYMLGFRMIRLYVDPGTGNGHVDLLPNNRGSAVVTIGIDGPLPESTGVLLHELYEAVMIDMNSRYKRSPSFSTESSDYIFVVTHNDLNEAHERIGVFMFEAYGDFVRAHKKFHSYKK